MATKKTKKETKNVSKEIIEKELAGAVNAAKAKVQDIIEEGPSGLILKDKVAKRKQIELPKLDDSAENKVADKLQIPVDRLLRGHHDPLHWSTVNDLLVKADKCPQFIGKTTKVGQGLQRKDKDSTVYETTEEETIITSFVCSGRVLSIPDHLKHRFDYKSKIVFDSRAAKVMDYDVDKNFYIVPAHAVFAVVEEVFVMDEVKNVKKGPNGTIKYGMRGNTVGRFMQRLGVWLGRINVFKRSKNSNLRKGV